VTGAPTRARRRAGTGDDTPDTLRDRLLAAMAEPGCPLCGLVREQERRYFFWFFAEHYHAPETLAQLVASHGFCRGHAGRLAVRGEDKAAAIGVVYEIVSSRVGSELAAEGARPRPTWPPRALGRCPACASRERTEHRFLESLAELLQDGDEPGRYRPPHLLCHSHLRQLEPYLGVAALQRVLGIHLRWLGGAAPPVEPRPRPDAGRAGARPGPAEETAAGNAERGSLASLVREAALDDVAASVDAVERAPLDVERAVRGALDAPDRCPVCAATTDALHAWQGYCEAHVSGGERPGDLLPTCDAHVSAFLASAGPALRLAVLQNLAARVNDTLTRAQAALAEAPARTRRARLARLASGPRESPEQRARDTLRRDIACPVCSMLGTAEARAVTLLDVLLRRDPDARRYAAGHGLCLRHLRVALAPGSGASQARALLRHAQGDVELLAWRLREAGRLDAWNVRPLPDVPDQTVWRRALYRYVGEPS